jgi:hypothetical protein
VLRSRHATRLETPVSATEGASCALCKDVSVPIKGGGAVQWDRQDTPELHYMATAGAMRRWQWAQEDRLLLLRDQISTIFQKGRVAWVDVRENGDFVFYHAPHGQVPANIPRTPR